MINTQLFRAARKNIKRKGSESKRAEEKERKRAINKFGTGNRKKSNFGLRACIKLKCSIFLYLILEKSICLVKKYLFHQK